MLSFEAVAIGVVASLSWALMDAARKWLAHSFDLLTLSASLAFGQSFLLCVLWFIQGEALPQSDYLIYGVAGILLSVIGLLTFLAALKSAPLSVTAPLLALTPAICALLEWGIDHRELSIFQWEGTIMGVSAAILLMRDPSGKWSKGAWLMILVALTFSGCIVLDRHAIAHASRSFHAMVQSLGSLCIFGVLWLWQTYLAKKPKVLSPRGRWPIIILLLTMLLFAGAVLLQLAAIQLSPAAPYEALKRAIGVAGAVLIGHFLFHEAISVRKLLASGALAVSAVILSLSY